MASDSGERRDGIPPRVRYVRRPPPVILNPTAGTQGMLPDLEIRTICQNLADAHEYDALSRFARTSKRHRELCQPALEKIKEAAFLYEVADDAELALRQSGPHPDYFLPHTIFIQPTADSKINDVISMSVVTNESRHYWLAQREFNPRDPQDWGWKSKSFHPTRVDYESEARKLLKLGYVALMLYRRDGKYQYEEFEQLIKRCRRHRGSCFFFYAVVS